MIKNNYSLKYSGVKAVGLVTLLALALLSWGAKAVNAAPAQQTGSATDQLRPLTGADFEKQFLSLMITHHQGAVEMATLVADRASHAEIKSMAQDIISAQTSEISEMTNWLQSWYNTAPMGSMGGMNMNMGMGDMSKLPGLSGDAFDKEFLIEMRMHHMSAIEMAQLVPDRATHSELKTLAQNILSSQTGEIQQMETWLRGWYNVDGSGAALAAATPATTATPSVMPHTGQGESAAPLPQLLVVALSLLIAGGFLTLRAKAKNRA